MEVFFRAADVFVSTEMAFLFFLGHVIALLRASYVPQAFFCSTKVTFLGFLGHVIALLRYSYVPKPLFSGKQ